MEGGVHPPSSKLRRELQLNSQGRCMHLDHLVQPNILGLQLPGSSFGQSQVLRGKVDEVPGRIFHPRGALVIGVVRLHYAALDDGVMGHHQVPLHLLRKLLYTSKLGVRAEALPQLWHKSTV